MAEMAFEHRGRQFRAVGEMGEDGCDLHVRVYDGQGRCVGEMWEPASLATQVAWLCDEWDNDDPAGTGCMLFWQTEGEV